MNRKHPLSMVVLAVVLVLLVTLIYFLDLLSFSTSSWLWIIVMSSILEFCIVVDDETFKKGIARTSLLSIPRDAPIRRLLFSR